MAPTQSEREWDLPVLKATKQIQEYDDKDIYSVKFYPYTAPGEDPIFAVVGREFVIVFRITLHGRPETIKVLEISVSVDEEREEDLYSCVWTKDPLTGTPLICAAGCLGVIYIIDVLKGEILRVLTGHGGDINDLAISPTSPYILASASFDYTVRIWSLDPAHERHPLAAMLLGEGHKGDVYTIAFHQSGRYLLSGGADSIANLWTLPIFPDKNTGTSKPTLIRYPHFSSSELHDGRIIDCIAWHGDLILSKSEQEEVKEKENTIVLWRITAFDSSLPPPLPSQAPAIQGPETKSYFDSSDSKFTRLAHFHIEDGDILFTRFGLSPVVDGMGPVLAFMSKYSCLKFWDLRRLRAYAEYRGSLEGEDGPQNSVNRPGFLDTFPHSRSAGSAALSRVRGASIGSVSSSTSISGYSESAESGSGAVGGGGGGGASVDWKKSAKKWEGMYKVGDLGLKGGLKPHKEVGVEGKLGFTGRMVAWSGDARWCVVVGSMGSLVVFGR